MSLMYKKVTVLDVTTVTLPAVIPAVPSAQGVQFSSLILDAVNQNQNALVLDIDTSASGLIPAQNINIYLPSITSLMFGGSSKLNSSGTLVGDGKFVGGGGMSFYINGTRTGLGLDAITFWAYQRNNPTENDVDIICGTPTFVVPVATNACFTIFISGRHSWCAMSCAPLT